MMKKMIARALILIFLMTTIMHTVSASTTVKVFINGVEVVSPQGEDIAFISIHGQTVIGARSFIDALKRHGLQGVDDIAVGYCQPNHSSMWGKQLVAEDLKKYDKLPNGELRTFFDGVEGVLIDSNGLAGVPVIQNDRTYFPLRALLNWIGITDIVYDEIKGEVHVTIPKGTKLKTRPENVVVHNQEEETNAQDDNALSNLRYNEALGSVTGYINGQGREPYCNFKYGLYDMSYNGCGVIGVHNALVNLGKGKELRDVIYYHETNGSIIDGMFGTNPVASAGYLAMNDCDVKVMYDVTAFDDVAKTSKVCILTFWNTSSILDGAHTVALTKNADGSIVVYNYHNNSSTTSDFDSISKMLTNAGHVPIVMLGVNNK